MKKVLVVVATLLFVSSFAAAQASRTWVSGVGDDANPCSRTAPCKTFAGAISKTVAGGEIDALDPAGYGAVTITKAITIDGGGGQVASVLVAGTNGIVIQAGASDVVILRNLRFNGLRQDPNASPGINAIDLKVGTLIVENCDIFGFGSNGILEEGTTNKLVVRNTTSYNNGNTGIEVLGGTAAINSSDLSGNSHGLIVIGGKVTATNTTASQNSGRGFSASGGELNVTDSVAANNAIGVGANGGTVRVGGSTITDNGTGISITSGTVTSLTGNRVVGNTSTTAPSGTTSPI